MNLYAYVTNNPIMFMDPMGLDEESILKDYEKKFTQLEKTRANRFHHKIWNDQGWSFNVTDTLIRSSIWVDEKSKTVNIPYDYLADSAKKEFTLNTLFDEIYNKYKPELLKNSTPSDYAEPLKNSIDKEKKYIDRTLQVLNWLRDRNDLKNWQSAEQLYEEYIRANGIECPDKAIEFKRIFSEGKIHDILNDKSKLNQVINGLDKASETFDKLSKGFDFLSKSKDLFEAVDTFTTVPKDRKEELLKPYKDFKQFTNLVKNVTESDIFQIPGIKQVMEYTNISFEVINKVEPFMNSMADYSINIENQLSEMESDLSIIGNATNQRVEGLINIDNVLEQHK